jgi:hypothetical protein
MCAAAPLFLKGKLMVAVVLDSWPDDKISRISGIGVNSDIPARWEQVTNANPNTLAPGEIVEFDCRRSANGQTFYGNIRILTGRAERVALNGPALRPRYTGPTSQRESRRNDKRFRKTKRKVRTCDVHRELRMNFDSHSGRNSLVERLLRERRIERRAGTEHDPTAVAELIFQKMVQDTTEEKLKEKLAYLRGTVKSLARALR